MFSCSVSGFRNVGFRASCGELVVARVAWEVQDSYKNSADHEVCVRWTPHSVIVTVRDDRDYMRVLLYSYFTTITGRGVLLSCTIGECMIASILALDALYSLCIRYLEYNWK